MSAPEPGGGLSAFQLSEIRDRLAQATPGPWVSFLAYGTDRWEVDQRNGPIVCGNLGPAANRYSGGNAAFIAHAREDIPALLVTIDALTQAQRDQAERLAAVERQNVRLRAVLRRVLVDRPNWEHREGILVVTEGWWMHWEAEARAAIVAEPEGA